jgi:hypothetical protein
MNVSREGKPPATKPIVIKKTAMTTLMQAFEIFAIVGLMGMTAITWSGRSRRKPYCALRPFTVGIKAMS